jgi:hypothetical protein
VPSFPTGKLSYTVQIGDQLYGITNLTSNSYSTNIPYTIPSTTTTEIPISLTFYAENIPDSTLKDIYTNILIGMYYYSSVITDVGSGCDSKCPVKTGFSSGLDLTTDPPTCIYCSTTSNLVYSGELNDGKGGCGCKLFSCLSSATQSTAPTVNTVGSTTTFAFSADQEVCLPTTDPLCAICTATLLASSTTEYKDPVCDRCTENAYLTTDLKCLC